MRVRSHVGGSGDDSEQSDNHESGNPSMLGHGNPSQLEMKWLTCTKTPVGIPCAKGIRGLGLDRFR